MITKPKVAFYGFLNFHQIFNFNLIHISKAFPQSLLSIFTRKLPNLIEIPVETSPQNAERLSSHQAFCLFRVCAENAVLLVKLVFVLHKPDTKI